MSDCAMRNAVELPAHWAAGSPRLRAWLAELWARLPDPETAMLAHVVRDVIEGQSPYDPAPRLGACAYEDFPGFAAVVYVDLARISDDRAGLWIVAHELAHAALRHASMQTILGALAHFNPEVWDNASQEMLRGLAELQADLLAAVVWNFQAELRAYLAAFPNARRPQWLRTENNHD